MLNVILFILCCLIFGSTWIAVKIGLQSTPPFTGAVIRCVIAFLVFGLIFRLWRFRFPPIPNIRRDFWIVGIAMYGVSFGLIYWGQVQIASSMSAILYATMPFFTGIFAHFMLRDEKLNSRVVIGQIVGFAGTILLFAGDLQFGGSFFGMAAMVISSCCCSWATVKTKRDLKEIDPKAMAILQLPAGLMLLIPCMLFLEYPPNLAVDARGLGSVLYLAIFGTGLAFILWYYLLQRVSAVALSLMTFIEPLVASVLGYLILAETLNSRTLTGGGLILIGVLIVTIRKQ